MNIKEKVMNWMLANARPLELARFKYLFLNGTKDDYLREIKKFQTASGGFANGMEPDTWNPNPSAIQTWTAIHYIMDLNLVHTHPVIQGITTYLEKEMEKRELFQTVIPTNNNYPHAIWWHYKEDTSTWGYNPSVALWAFLYRVNKNELAKQRLLKAFDDFIQEPKTEMHELKCFVDAYEWLYDFKDEFENFNFFEHKLYETITHILKDFELKDKNIYGPTPLSFCDHPDTHIYGLLKPYIDKQVISVVDYIENNDMWGINFAWGQYEKEFEQVKPVWQSILAIHNCRFLFN